MQIINDRRALHQIPELELALPKTMEYLYKALSGLKCRLFSPMESSLCAYFDFGQSSTIAFRADCDALPIEEKFIGFENATSRKNLMYRFLIGAGCVGLVFGLFSFLPFEFLDLIAWKFVKYFCTVLTGVLLVPYLFKKAKV